MLHALSGQSKCVTLHPPALPNGKAAFGPLTTCRCAQVRLQEQSGGITARTWTEVSVHAVSLYLLSASDVRAPLSKHVCIPSAAHQL